MLQAFSTDSLVLAGYSYQSNGEVYLQVDDISEYPTKRYNFLIKGQWFSLRLLGVKYCVGAYDAAMKQYVPCPQQKQISLSYTNCYNCSQVAAFNPAFYQVPIEQISVKQQQYNLQQHATYLAYFGKGHVKVGIAHEKRILRRWLEQGARAAVVLHVSDTAYQARELEEAVSRLYQIPERVTSQKKQKLLHMPYDFQVADEILGKYQAMIHDAYSIEPNGYTVQDLQAYYFDKQPSRLQVTPQHHLHIGGECITLVGDILIYKHQESDWMQAIKSWIGRASIKMVKEEIIHEAIQTQLF